MFKGALNKTTLLILAATAVAGVLFLFLFMRHRVIARYGKGVPFEEGPFYAERMLKKPTGKITGKRMPTSGMQRIKENARLPLRLVGIYEHAAKKTACIENLTTFKTGYYGIGDSVMKARVIQILSGQVVLLKDGRRIILSMENPYAWSKPDEWIDAVSKDNFIVSRKRLNQHIRGVNQLLGEIVAVPYVSNHGIEGFSIASIKKDGIISEAGFREGDIVRSVNGRKMDSLKEPLLAYQQLRNLVNGEEGPVIKIELQRNDKIRIFTYRILK